jgi:hypothetical protein
MAISYGSYVFPSPSPLVVLGDEPIYVAGELDSTLSKISIIGSITGQTLSGLNYVKNQMITGVLTNRYSTLTIEGETFPYCKPISLSFSDSDLTTILPYSLELERYDKKTFSKYYGVLEPTNSWSYQEQENRITQATHTVSARGVKTGQFDDPLVTARNFVNSNLSGFENFSIINPSGIAFLISKTEEVDRFTNSYSVTENYSILNSSNPISNQAIITTNTQISYSKKGEPSVNVNGSIIGSITGAKVTTGLFTPDNAKTVAGNLIQRSKASQEENLYGELVSNPTSYNYNINDVENKIDFTFQFRNPFNIKESDVLNTYSVNISASKDSNTLTASINGELTYDSSFDIFSNQPIESSPRYLKIEAALNSINFYNLVSQRYSDFIQLTNNIYETSNYLNQNPTSTKITKNPYKPSISYSYSYDNRVDYSNGQLKDLQFSISNSLPIPITEILESNNGFTTQQTISKTLGQVTINGSSNDDESKMGTLKSVLEAIPRNTSCQDISSSKTTSDSSISYSKSFYYSS